MARVIARLIALGTIAGTLIWMLLVVAPQGAIPVPAPWGGTLVLSFNGLAAAVVAVIYAGHALRAWRARPRT